MNGDVETVRRKLDAELAAGPGRYRRDPPNGSILAGVYPFRVASWLGSSLGGLALLLTLSGIYGVLSYLITQRTKEIGIRVALGATTGNVARLVLAQSMRLVAVGVALGTALSLAVSRLLPPHISFS